MLQNILQIICLLNSNILSSITQYSSYTPNTNTNIYTLYILSYNSTHYYTFIGTHKLYVNIKIRTYTSHKTVNILKLRHIKLNNITYTINFFSYILCNIIKKSSLKHCNRFEYEIVILTFEHYSNNG